MEDHFSRMLDPAAAGSAVQGSFVPTKRFEGQRPGYVFKMGNYGLGYYRDQHQELGNEGGHDGLGMGVKRERDGESNTGDGGNQVLQPPAQPQEDVRLEDMALEDLDEEAIARLLEEADKVEVSELDPTGVKQLLLGLEKKINKNQMMRVKYPDQPERFVESEVDLDGAIKTLSVVAAAPELYPVLIEAGAVTSLLGLLTHENTDISISVLLLLQELTDSDVLSEREEAMVIVDAIVERQGLELLVQNLSRLDESNEEDAKGVNTTMGVLENLIEACPSLGPTLCEPPMSVLRFLLKRLSVKKFDENKLYCSEILAMLVNGDSDVQRRLGTLQGMDGIDMLLQVVAYYRRREPQSPEEEECVENLFNSLAAALLIPDNQARFRFGEGFELMLRCLREKKHASWCAVKVLDFALTDNPTNCHRLVEVGGLKAVLPVFMGRGAARRLRKKKRKARGERNNLEEHCISIVTSLAIHLEDRQDSLCLSRFVSKFVEVDMEKVERVFDLYMEYSERVARFEEAYGKGKGPAGEEEDSDEDEDEDTLSTRRLEAGAYTQQRLAVVIVLTAARSKAVAKRMDEKLHQHGWSLLQVRYALDEYINNLGDASPQRERLLALLPPPVPEEKEHSGFGAGPGSEERGGQEEQSPIPPPPPPSSPPPPPPPEEEEEEEDDIDMDILEDEIDRNMASESSEGGRTASSLPLPKSPGTPDAGGRGGKREGRGSSPQDRHKNGNGVSAGMRKGSASGDDEVRKGSSRRSGRGGGGSRSRSRSNGRGRARDRSRSRGKSRSRSGSKGRRDRGRERRDRVRERTRDRSRSRDRGRDKSRSRSRGRDRGKERSSSRDRRGDRGRDVGHRRESGKDRDREGRREDRERGRDGDRRGGGKSDRHGERRR